MLLGIDSSRRIRVRGREGEEIEWSRAAAVRSGRLSYWLNDIESPEDDVFPIPNVSSAVLREIGVMCEADWSAERLDGCSLAELATIVEGAIILDAELALGYAQAAFAKRLDGKRANELRLLFGAVDDFESDAGPRTRARAQRARDERVEALAEPAFTPDNSTLQYATITIAALDVNDDVAGVALAKVSHFERKIRKHVVNEVDDYQISTTDRTHARTGPDTRAQAHTQNSNTRTQPYT